MVHVHCKCSMHRLQLYLVYLLYDNNIFSLVFDKQVTVGNVLFHIDYVSMLLLLNKEYTSSPVF